MNKEIWNDYFEFASVPWEFKKSSAEESDLYYRREDAYIVTEVRDVH